MDEKVKLENGKYTFFIADNGHTVGCLRFNEPWVIFREGSKAIISLLSLLFSKDKKIKELEVQLSELRNAIDSAQEDNIDEVHCSCVPLLKVKIKELEEKLKILTYDCP